MICFSQYLSSKNMAPLDQPASASSHFHACSSWSQNTDGDLTNLYMYDYLPIAVL